MQPLTISATYSFSAIPDCSPQASNCRSSSRGNVSHSIFGNTVGSPPIKQTHGSRDTSTFSSAHGSFVSSLMRCPSAPYLLQQSKRSARGKRWHTQSEHFGDCVHLAAPTRREPERRLPIRDAAHGRAHETCNPGIVQTSRIFPVCFATPSSHSSTLRFCFGSGRWGRAKRVLGRSLESGKTPRRGNVFLQHTTLGPHAGGRRDIRFRR